MKLFYSDLVSEDDKWQGLNITIQEQDRKPNFYIETCGERFFRLKYTNQTLFWARQHFIHYGACIIKTFSQPKIEEHLVSPILSHDIENNRNLSELEKLKAWSKYFVFALKRNKNAFYYNGNWEIKAFIPITGSWDYRRINNKESYLGYSDLEKSINNDVMQYVSWFCSNNNPLDFVSLRVVDKNSGRLKWWRKKVRENTLPPILLYFVSGLDTYIILDGHYRLMASILENVAPNILTISPYQRHTYNIDPSRKTQMLNTLENRKRNRQLNTKQKNDLLIQAHTETEEYFTQTTKAWSCKESVCVKEMVQHLDSINKAELAQKFFDVSDGKGW